jgi:hypothetical protein
MAKKVSFKDPSARIIARGIGEVNSDNLTIDLYNRLLELSESHADQFILSDDEELKAKSKNKPKNNEDEQSNTNA